MENKKKLLPILVLTVLISNVLAVNALTPEEKASNKEERSQMKLQKEEEKKVREETREAKKIATCTEVVSKIGNRKTQLEKSITNYQAKISRIETSLNTRIQELKTEGKDTSEIETNIVKFKSDAQGILSQRQALLTQLQNIDTSSCQTDKRAFSKNSKAFNASLKSVVTAQNNLKIFIIDNIVAKIKALKETTTNE